MRRFNEQINKSIEDPALLEQLNPEPSDVKSIEKDAEEFISLYKTYLEK